MQHSPKNLYNKILGVYGETLAVKMLKKKGYRILARNYRCFYGEADIVAQDGEDIVFIEVKTRSNTDFGAPVEAVDDRKQQKYYDIAAHYVKNIEKVPVRFDVVEILRGKATHIRNAF